MEQIDYNVDIVCNDTGEVFAEGLHLEAAHDMIADNGWVHVETTSDDLPAGDIDDAVRCFTFWIKDPEVDVAADLRRQREAAAYWGYAQSN